MKRLTDWRGRFSDAMNAAATKPHVYGEHDCLVGHIGPGIEALTGEDLYSQHKGQYDNAESAKAYLASLGYATLGDCLAAQLPEIPPARVHIGDVVTIGIGDGAEALGQVVGSRVMVLAPQGKATVSLQRIQRAFRVG